MTAEDYQLQAKALRDELIGIALHYLGNADEAEDIVQDTMLKLWLMREKLTPPIGGLAAVVTRNLCIDYLRRQQKAVDLGSLTDEADISDDGEEIERMLQIIDTLPSAQRTMLRMHHLEGMKTREIATVMGSTEVAVRKTLSRARREVRRKLIAWLAAACLVAGVSTLAVYLVRVSQEEECVAYVYGKKYTDRQTVIKEMRRTLGEMVEDDPQQEIEQQLNELFNE